MANVKWNSQIKEAVKMLSGFKKDQKKNVAFLEQFHIIEGEFFSSFS